MHRTLIATVLLAGAAVGAQAQTTADSTVQRDVNQQTRIETGLQNGTITTREGARLEAQEAAVDKLQQRDLKRGPLTPQEQAQLTRAQDRTSRDIHNAVTNGVNGNPSSGSSQREQQEVQRNIKQESRIQSGIADGGLTNHEAGRLEGSEARVDAHEYVAGRDGRVSANEQARVNTQDNRVSANIHQQRWDGQRRR